MAVVDSGWDLQLSEERVSRGVSFYDAHAPFVPILNRDTRDEMGHGTACADVVMQTAACAEVVPVRVFGPTLETDVRVLVAAIRWCVKENIRVINLSLGTTDPSRVRGLETVCNSAADVGAFLIAPTGELPTLMAPGSYASVIGVRKSEQSLGPMDFLADPSGVSDVVADTHSIKARSIESRFWGGTGASLAAAKVSGAAAIVLWHHPTIDRTGLLKLLLCGDMPLLASQSRSDGTRMHDRGERVSAPGSDHL